MIGELPTALEVCGEQWEIRSDYRNILRIFEAMEDESLNDSEKLYVMLDRMYVDFKNMPKGCYEEAYKEACKFIEYHEHKEEKNSPKLINWEKDEHMIFPAINTVAGCEIRAVEYMHWWTFLGYFESVDNESLWSFVLSIRQKRAKGKKLEKHEQEFFKQNQELCAIEWKAPKESAEDMLASIFDSLPDES